MTTINFTEAAGIGLCHITEWLPNGKRQGTEYLPVNPTRADAHPGSFSINLKTGEWSDFATGDKGGDAVSLFAYINGTTQKEAAQSILERYGDMPIEDRKTDMGKPAQWEGVYPAPDGVDAPSMRHWVHGTPSASWVYRDKTGKPMFYIARYDTQDGKEIVPWSFCRLGSKQQWRTKGHPGPRPLYNLDRLAAEPSKPVLIVEGEKCADAAGKILTGYVVTTWQGGANAVKKTDWTPLHGRTIVIWPDLDEPGKKAAGVIRALLPQASIIENLPQGKPAGWDIADAITADGWGGDDLLHLINNKPEHEAHAVPFRALGHDHGVYYFLPDGALDVISCRGTTMNAGFCTDLAPLSHWEVDYPGKRGPNWLLAASDLKRACEKVGPYDPSRIRGRGAWFDSGRVVLHLGNRILDCVKTVDIEDFQTPYIYERRPAIGTPNAIAVEASRASELICLLESLNWTQSSSAYLLAGWCFLAPICGALEWRPHAWLTGPAGSGKTWIMDNIVRPLMGNNFIHALGASSEAGIRQTLQNDALPVIIDEAESEKENQKNNIQNILTLMRQASSESGAKIYRGTVSGKNMEFCIRSMFLLSSIGMGIVQHADESRIVALSLGINRAADAREKFERIFATAQDLLTDEFCSGVRARAVSMIPTIRHNAKIFSKKVALMFGTQRSGDQYGTLLAGAYGLARDGEIDEGTDISIWLDMLKPCESDIAEEVSNERACLQTLLDATIKLPTEGGLQEFTIGELIAIVAGRSVMTDNDRVFHDADMALRRRGIRCAPESVAVYIAAKHSGLRELLSKTPWEINYSQTLRNLPGARAFRQVRFTPTSSCYSTEILFSTIFDS